MKKNIYFIFTILLIFSLKYLSLKAQQQGLDIPIRCYSTEYYNNLKKDSIVKKELEQAEIELKKSLDIFNFNKDKRALYRNIFSNNNNGISDGVIDTITLVFHILLPSNLQTLVTDDVIKRQVELLNMHFINTNANRESTPDIYKSRRKGADIRFALAKTAPDFSETNGIKRYLSNIIYDTIFNGLYYFQNAKIDTKGGINPWDTKNFINIWVVQLKNLLGVSTWPTDANNRGIVLNYKAVGDNTVANYLYTDYASGITLVHEMGHYFNLIHIWADENLCNRDDEIDDTPQQKASNIGACPVFPETKQLCLPTTADVSSMYMNYMDYTNDICMNLFTAGQIKRIEDNLYAAPLLVPLRSSKYYTEILKYNNNIVLLKIIDQKINNCETLAPIIQIKNKGKFVLRSLDIECYLDNVFQFKETWNGVLNPLDTALIYLKTKIAQQNQAINIVVSKPNGVPDEDSTNNIQSFNPINCPFDTPDDYILAYNPTNKQLIFRIKNNLNGLVKINILNQDGNVLKSIDVAVTTSLPIYIDCNNMPLGLYFVQLVFSKNIITKPINIF